VPVREAIGRGVFDVDERPNASTRRASRMLIFPDSAVSSCTITSASADATGWATASGRERRTRPGALPGCARGPASMRPDHPDHLVASRHQLRDELSAEHACGAGYENLHHCPSRLIYPMRRDRGFRL
jgi:hypothetical protein